MTDIVPDDQIDGGPIDKGPPVLTSAEQQLAFAREERDWYEAALGKALARGAALETALIERSNQIVVLQAQVATLREHLAKVCEAAKERIKHGHSRGCASLIPGTYFGQESKRCTCGHDGLIAAAREGT